MAERGLTTSCALPSAPLKNTQASALLIMLVWDLKVGSVGGNPLSQCCSGRVHGSQWHGGKTENTWPLWRWAQILPATDQFSGLGSTTNSLTLFPQHSQRSTCLVSDAQVGESSPGSLSVVVLGCTTPTEALVFAGGCVISCSMRERGRRNFSHWHDADVMPPEMQFLLL